MGCTYGLYICTIWWYLKCEVVCSASFSYFEFYHYHCLNHPPSPSTSGGCSFVIFFDHRPTFPSFIGLYDASCLVESKIVRVFWFFLRQVFRRLCFFKSDVLTSCFVCVNCVLCTLSRFICVFMLSL
ncbi:hypothetical protein HanRHA438_Chr05g0247091 [Helianthus annuus]|nr:hypothetical protein HanRHA438_Chr05g0247091 [Helianthus annuus]